MYDGIINIYKEKGFTSHDVVAKLRGMLKQKKIGHTGTLDPDATGVLPVCLGKATKLCELLTDKEKAYRTTFLLGRETDTQDIWGKVINDADVSAMRDRLTDKYIEDTVMSFVGEYSQIPPMYSAIKINGRKLYELAREGIEVERKPRDVRITGIRNIEINFPYVSMEVSCSKGTYIRTLCHDIGIKAGTYGCMTELERIQSGIFMKESAVTLKELETYLAEGTESKIIIPIDSMFENLNKITVPDTAEKLLYNGNPIPCKEIKDVEISGKQQVRVYDCQDKFMGIYVRDGKMLKPEKLFL